MGGVLPTGEPARREKQSPIIFVVAKNGDEVVAAGAGCGELAEVALRE